MDKKKEAIGFATWDELIAILKLRFGENMDRHKGVEWKEVESKIIDSNEKMRALYEMEKTGGEPDLILYGENSNEFIFFDCAEESPIGRRSICYDNEALEGRKENKPKDNAIDMATEMGIEILTEEQYRELQKYGKFDTKTSSWVKTPDDIRKLGGAIFCDRRYNVVFKYHNGAESYYSSRGFRGLIKI